MWTPFRKVCYQPPILCSTDRRVYERCRPSRFSAPRLLVLDRRSDFLRGSVRRHSPGRRRLSCLLLVQFLGFGVCFLASVLFFRHLPERSQHLPSFSPMPPWHLLAFFVCFRRLHVRPLHWPVRFLWILWTLPACSVCPRSSFSYFPHSLEPFLGFSGCFLPQLLRLPAFAGSVPDFDESTLRMLLQFPPALSRPLVLQNLAFHFELLRILHSLL